MPNSFDDYKIQIRHFFKKSVPKGTNILDVGPGKGTYWHLLQNLGYKMDCVEIFKPYIEEYKLKEKYDNVYLDNIINFDITKYELIILGDILEHLSVDDAHIILNKINKNNQKCIIAVPYLSEQEADGGNHYQIHLQPDLTPELMLQRYPSLKLLIGNKRYGYYINKFKKAV
jgi:hypothetical protein|tara:strand:- start:15686 stop:16201 length:516 start_codon:yes stop_codon:yes gene_type:complete